MCFAAQRTEKLRALVTERSVGVGHLPQKSTMTKSEKRRSPVSRAALPISKTRKHVP
jgi:hypothetical protein